MMSEYQKIFEKRGIDYHAAMQRYPFARDAEFSALFTEIDCSVVKKLADIPAGGGYLKRFLPLDCDIDYLEPCNTFKSHSDINNINLERLSLPFNKYDVIVNLAAIHHIKNKQHFISSLFDALKPQGYLCIGDVLAESNIAYFLDKFAGKYNATGHNGCYLTLQSITDIVLPLNFQLIENKIKNCDWVFDDEKALLDFCRLLFGLCKVTDKVLLTALNDTLGISYHKGTSKNTRLSRAILTRSHSAEMR